MCVWGWGGDRRGRGSLSSNNWGGEDKPTTTVTITET